MFVKQLALISESPEISFAQTALISAALQKQITRDFSPIWNIEASVNPFNKLDDVPPGYWPIIIKDDINYPGAAGIHLDRNGQPYALVQASDETALTCSHEVLEMLADPFGNNLIASESIKPEQGRVNFLIEVCDPSEALEFGYKINGIGVSDFYTPNFFDPITAQGVRYSFTSAIKKPREILKGGYISWMLPQTREWWQAIHNGTELTFKRLGVLERQGKSWRELIDSLTFGPVKERNKHILSSHAGLSAEKSIFSAAIANTSNGWANLLKEDINATISAAKK